ncbi:MAG: ATP-binding protein [Sulfurovum sp.]|nr:ATP-binding protein [Sulfurovum sp.]
MLVTTKQIVKRLSKNFKLTSIIEEAITNSIQANATEIKIYFETLPVDLTKETRKVKKFSIIDNGDGFTNENIDSFNHYLSDYKETLGCKGIGRFTYLTICEKVKFKSYNNGENIEFDFDIDREIIKPIRLPNEPLIQKTKVDFIDVKERVINIDFKGEEKEIIGHFLSTFKFMVDDNKNVMIRSYIDNKLVSTIEAKEHGKGFEDEIFTIKVGENEEKFTVSYKQKGSSIKGYYCADKRSVKQDTLGLKFTTAKDKGILYFVSSKYFDKHVDDSRNSFNIKDKNDDLFSDGLDWDTINRKLFVTIDSVCKKYGIDIDAKVKENQSKSLRSAPYLASYIKKSTNKANSAEIIKEAKERFNSDKEYIRNIKNKNKPDYEERLYVSNQAELAEYIFDREKIINDIKADLENVNQKSNETIIHNKIMQTKTSNDSDKLYKNNNLWLFDERFMIYNYAYSDVTINKILDLKDKDKNTRPDICIFTKSESDIKDIVLIELKGSDATGEKNSAGINELNKYTRKIKDYFEKNGEEVRIWSYLITTLNDETKQELEDMSGMKKTYMTKGEMFYIHNEKLNAITHILTLETMIEDALGRNQLFLDILKGEY